jgi:transposase
MEEVLVQIQLPLFLSFEQVQDQPLPKKYAMLFSVLDLSDVAEYNYGVGADGTSQHALLRAFIIRSLEELKTVSALIKFLEANEALKHLCGFRNGRLPHNSQFYRFLRKTNHSLFENLLVRVNKILLGQGILGLRVTAVDSKPVKALTKENNPKHPGRNLRDKTRKPKRNPRATLGYYSHMSGPDHATQKKQVTFFWGYRSHVIVDVNSGLVLVEGTYPNNMPDEKVARKLLKKLKRLYRPKRGMIVIADKAYDERDFYTFVVEQIKGEPIIPLNPRKTKRDKKISERGHRICQAGLEMTPAGTWQDGNRRRLKERCPLKVSKRVAAKYPDGCPCNHPRFAGYGCTAYHDVTDDARARVQRDTPRYKSLYGKRIVVEQTFSRAQELEIEEARHYGLTTIRNANTIDYLALALVALAAVRMKKPHKIRCYRSLWQAA